MLENHRFLEGGGRMGEAILRLGPDSPLGSPADWPGSLMFHASSMLNLGQAAFIAWGHELTVLYNDAYVPLLGAKHPRALGSGYFDVWHEIADDMSPSVRRVMAGERFDFTDISVKLTGRRGPEVGHFDFAFSPLRDDAWQIAGFLCICRETTAAVEAKAAADRENARVAQMLRLEISERAAQLTDRENLIRIFFQHSSECHAVLEEVSEGRFRYQEINPATLKLYGRTREQIVGRMVEEVFDPETAQALNAHLSAAVRSNAPYQYERIQGDSVVEALAAPVSRDPGGSRRLVVSARDVSERRRMEQQLRQAQKMDAIGHLTGGIAHDFNNLLTGITGTLELIQVRVAQGRYSELERYIASGQGAARRAAALTHRLLAFARRQTLDAKPTDANRLIADMADLIQRTVGPEIKLEVVGAVGLWKTLVDANQLENALLNLCINARDAMPGGGTITIETANRWIDDRMARDRELVRGQYISVCVSDTGCGMPPNVVAQAFDPFFTTKPIGQGTGLGLSMIYGFAKQSGGQARIYSEPAQGTMVCLYLPRFTGVEPPVEETAETAPSGAAAEGETVLVVDDEATVRLLATEVLTDLGYVSLESADGVSALQILQSKHRVDLLITDVGLPNGMNGRQLADAARALRSDLKVLFITGYAENAVFSHGHLQEGFQVLSKPFSMELLANRVADLMKSAPRNRG